MPIGNKALETNVEGKKRDKTRQVVAEGIRVPVQYFVYRIEGMIVIGCRSDKRVCVVNKVASGASLVVIYLYLCIYSAASTVEPFQPDNSSLLGELIRFYGLVG